MRSARGELRDQEIAFLFELFELHLFAIERGMELGQFGEQGILINFWRVFTRSARIVGPGEAPLTLGVSTFFLRSLSHTSFVRRFALCHLDLHGGI